jgi:hypothetical protein
MAVVVVVGSLAEEARRTHKATQAAEEVSLVAVRQ